MFFVFFLSSIFLLINVFVQLTSLKHSWLLSVFENVRDHPQPYMLHKKDPNARHTDRQAGSITKKNLMSLLSKIQRCEQKTGGKSCQQKAGKGKYKKLRSKPKSHEGRTRNRGNTRGRGNRLESTEDAWKSKSWWQTSQQRVREQCRA